MQRILVRLGFSAALSAALLALPLLSVAQTASKTTAAEKKAPAGAKPGSPKAEPKKTAHPFHGKLVAIDKAARTITVGKSTYQLGPETKIKKSGSPATLDDVVVGEDVGGYVKPNEEGKMIATTLNFGPKPEAKSTPRKNGKEK